MQYQALARKYRPRNFASLMGQEHVSKALSNALRTQRLHHAYLFSGTRGVGKTTIARILAKSLNCEEGVVADPCGTCATCQEIDEGRFIDLIEVDAASKTKVEDTREMLDNVQYAPVRGRYKVYLIDEVHMLSGHSFNALLKTLEEPPAHVKFLLATTDPQKLPITVLSRCLQFNLRALSLEQISQQLTKVLTEEKIDFEADAIYPIALAADGSMRDALSVLDQAIAFADGKLSLATIDSMLGNVPGHHILGVLSALIASNAQQLMHNLHEILSLGMGVDNVLIELINVFQKIAMMQMLAQSSSTSISAQNTHYEQQLLVLSNKISVEDIQLYYQIALSGRKDLQLSPFPQSALEMLLLRMLAFKPLIKNVADYSEQLSHQCVVDANDANNEAHLTTTKKKHFKNDVAIATDKIITHIEKVEEKYVNKAEDKVEEKSLTSFWNECVYKVSCSGIEKEVLLHSCLLEKHRQSNQLFIKLGLDHAHQALLNDKVHQRIRARLKGYFINQEKLQNNSEQSVLEDVVTEFTILPAQQKKQIITPKQTEKKIEAEQLQQAKCSIEEDLNVQLLIEHFSGKILTGSIKKKSKKRA